jgi:hypothetical protein
MRWFCGGTTTATLAIAKSGGFIDWPWWLVFTPILIISAWNLLMLVIVLIATYRENKPDATDT